MAIKDLAIAFNASENSLAALKFAIQMCNKYDAALTGVHAHMPVSFEGHVGRWVTADVRKMLQKAEDDAARETETRFRNLITDEGFKGEVHWISEEGQPNDILARTARYHDLLLIGQYSNPERAKRHVRAEELVLRSGKPILLVPNGYAVRPFKGLATVGWDGSRPAARALSDAMQILETKEQLDVVTVVGSKKKSAAPGKSDIIAHLNRHGINAKRVELSANREGVGPTILAHCDETDPDVLVMGAYSHAPLREELFGGVTRHIIQNTKVPVLLSH
ncbi:MAG: universal stress protein [Hyphomicrobiales bacterium]